MDDKRKELIAVGASAAVNCRPCMEYHLNLAREAGVSAEETDDALEIGLMVNRGAASGTKKYVEDLKSGVAEKESMNVSGSGCC